MVASQLFFLIEKESLGIRLGCHFEGRKESCDDFTLEAGTRGSVKDEYRTVTIKSSFRDFSSVAILICGLRNYY